MIISKDNTLHTRDTYNNPLNSEFIKATTLYHFLNQDILDFYLKGKSILTPKGFISLNIRQVEPTTFYLVKVANINKQFSVIIHDTTLLYDFTDNTYKTIDKLNSQSCFLSYTNTDTKCYGFIVQQAVLSLKDIVKKPQMTEAYEITTNAKSCYLERLLVKPTTH